MPSVHAYAVRADELTSRDMVIDNDGVLYRVRDLERVEGGQIRFTLYATDNDMRLFPIEPSTQTVKPDALIRVN